MQRYSCNGLLYILYKKRVTKIDSSVAHLVLLRATGLCQEEVKGKGEQQTALHWQYLLYEKLKRTGM